uniref:Caffeic acid O-methyltransferase n=1 Tax=Catalpa bungei TaxID=265496 RepID=A0A411ASH1_9LAMI|nr:caffeic acid O-methyltransferase [Catalpa bungei]QAX90965.1 caffeic acid O-methyltransferase [Catalpa bungei]
MVLDEEAQARADVWKYAFGSINTKVMIVVVQLQIPDIMKKHGGAISLSDLSAAVGVPADNLYRIMRFSIHHGMFKKTEPPQRKVSDDVVYYAHTPLSLLLTIDNVGPFILLQGAGPHGNFGGLTVAALKIGNRPDFKTLNGNSNGNGNGNGNWDDPFYATKVYTDAMACHARVATSAIIKNCPEAFRGIRTLVDVGGRHGMALSMLIKGFPWIKGIAFDLPEVVAKAPPVDGIQFVGGSMFEAIPKAEAIMLMWILHDWSDKACIDILKKCKEAIPADTGRVIIAEAVIKEDEEEDEYTGAQLSLDMIMMDLHIEGKERTYKEWAHLLKAAGFSRHNVKNMKTLVSVIEAYP